MTDTVCFWCRRLDTPDPACSDCGGLGHATTNDWEFICPHCGEEDSGTCELELDDDKTTETDCRYCDKVVEVTCSVTYSYRARRVS